MRLKTACLLAALILLVGMVPLAALSEGGSANEGADAKTGFTIMGFEPDSLRRWDGHAFFQTMAEATGVSIASFRQYSDMDAYSAAKTQAFQTGNLPDAFFKAALTAREEMEYAQSGQLINLAPLIPLYAPTINQILEARADWREEITQPGGVISSLPALSAYERQAYIWINRDWLTNVGKEMPTDAASLADVLAAFKTGDPNMNGKADEIPLSFIGPWEAKFFLHAFGLAPNDYNIYEKDGTVRFAPFEPQYLEFVDWLRALAADGLLDKNAFRQSQSQRQTLISEQKLATIGCFVSVAPYTLVKAELAEQYALLPPLPYNNAAVYRRLLPSVSHGAFAITSACRDVPAMLKWIDYLYTEQGGRLAAAGVEGVDYGFDGDGKWEWIIGDMNSIDVILRDRVMDTDSVTPGLEPADFQRRTKLALEARVRREGDAIRNTLVTPYPFTWPADAQVEDRIAELQSRLGPMVDAGVARFITGEMELSDQSWAAFLAELRENGADELVRLFQSKLKERE